MQPGVDLSLDKLGSLTRLAVAGEAIGDRTGGEIAQLTRLEVLKVAYTPNFTDVGLVGLTRLTRLQSLTIKFARFSRELATDRHGIMRLPTYHSRKVSM